MPATYESIATTTLGSNQTTVTISNIPTTFTDLVLVMTTKYTVNSNNYIALRYNGDTATNYSNTYVLGDGSVTDSSRSTSMNRAIVGNGSAAGSNIFNVLIVNIQNYSNTTTSKTSVSRSNDTSSFVSSYVSLWRKSPAEAITSIEVSSDNRTFLSGSTFTLYGIKAA